MNNMVQDDFYRRAAKLKMEISELPYAPSIERIDRFEDYIEYFDLPDIDTDIRLVNLSMLDKIFCVLFGGVGALTSNWLKEPFRKIHDAKYTQRDNPFLFEMQKSLEHGFDLNDKVRGLGHRVAYGHDIFNLKELGECVNDKFNYLSSQFPNSSNTFLKLHAGLKIAKHLILADPLSIEGLPVPGHTIFREKLCDFAKSNNELYQKLFTIKARDMTSTALVALFCKIYKNRFGIKSNSYRYFEINLLANSALLIFGYMLGSLNYPCVFKLLIDSIRMTGLSISIRNELLTNVSKDLEYLLCMGETKFGIPKTELRRLIK